MSKFLRVNMKDQSTHVEDPPSKYRLMGGRRLTAQLVSDEVPPTCEPLGRNNKVILAPGLLGGTAAPCSGRLSIGGKSPLTGGIKESNSGGMFGQKLARLGYKAVIIEEQPENGWYVLKIDGRGVSLLNADNLLGLDNYAACESLRKEHGDKVGLVVIGEAGEKQYTTATCAIADIDGIPARQAARGGMGAVMGNKGIKAVVLDDSEAVEFEFADEKLYRESCQKWRKELIEKKKVLTEYGTANLVMTTANIGCLATRNFSYGDFDKKESISGERLAETIKERGGDPSHNCMRGCPIRCSNVYYDANGNHLTSSLEFETIALVGSNLEIDDLDVIAKIDRFCDGYGIDTMDLGAAIGVAMEAGLLEFGDGEAALGLIDEIKNESMLGKVLVQGVAVTGRVLGARRIPAVKGQGLAGYDPRSLKGTGVTYATSPMGADHTAGNCLPGRKGYRPETQEDRDTGVAEGQVELSKDLQVLSTICDAAGLCFFVGTDTVTADYVKTLLNARYGEKLTVEDILQIGKDTILTELEFNSKAGITSAQNDLPAFFREEKLPPRDTRFDIDPSELVELYENWRE